MKSTTLSPEKVGRQKDGIWYILHRIAIILSCAAIFYPGFNPGRVTSAINRSVSLFTASLSYSSLTTNLGRVLQRGILSKGTFILIQAGSIVMVLGIILCLVGGCMSVGNNRMRHKGLLFPAIGSIVMGIGLGIFRPAGLFTQPRRDIRRQGRTAPGRLSGNKPAAASADGKSAASLAVSL